jgi:eukaryotic-like serine/threonine-protein kinase
LGRFSPDGRWVAYQSNESGQEEVYVIPFGGTQQTASAAQGTNTAAGKWQVSTGGGAAPVWRRDGKEIFYVSPNTGAGMAASVDGSGPAFSVGRVEPAFSVRVAPTGQAAGPQFGVAPDGQRFLVSLAEDIRRDTAPQPVTVVVNWAAALRK